ncbi:MAG: energy transducer TonB [Niabella sp.]
MEASKILQTDLLDIVFDGRNKAYGAYELRKTYNKRIVTALIITALIFSLIVLAAYLKSTFAKTTDDQVRVIEGLTIQSIDDMEKPDEPDLPPPPPPAAKQLPPPKVEMTAFVQPRVVADDQVKDIPPAIEDLRDTKISNISQEGAKYLGQVVLPPAEIDGNRGIIETRVKPEENNLPFEKVEIDASYPGGNSAWRNFLDRNLRPDVPVENGAPPGSYQVMVQFVVDVNGNVSDIKSLTHHGFGMEAEAERVIKKSGKWDPAIQNNRQVKAYRKQPITFQIME